MVAPANPCPARHRDETRETRRAVAARPLPEPSRYSENRPMTRGLQESKPHVGVFEDRWAEMTASPELPAPTAGRARLARRTFRQPEGTTALPPVAQPSPHRESTGNPKLAEMKYRQHAERKPARSPATPESHAGRIRSRAHSARRRTPPEYQAPLAPLTHQEKKTRRSMREATAQR